MSTRSVCAIPDGDGFRGRYVHSDGYPSAKVPEYLALVERDGLPSVIKKITEERYGWSTINPNQPDITGVAPPAEYPGWIASTGTEARAYYAYLLAPGNMYGDGRFANEPGYGIAYTTVENQSAEDQWITHDGDDWGTEWAYVLSDRGLAVYERLTQKWAKPEAWTKALYAQADKYSGLRGWYFHGFVEWGSSDDGSAIETAFQDGE